MHFCVRGVTGIRGSSQDFPFSKEREKLISIPRPDVLFKPCVWTKPLANYREVAKHSIIRIR